MDVLLYETGSGGDAKMTGNDLVMVDGYENMVYLAMFGGSGWWGNDLLLGNEDESVQFKSETEGVLKGVVLNSAGRIAVENAVKNDLDFLKKQVPGTTVDVKVVIVSSGRLDILVTIGGQLFKYSWNPDKQQLVVGV